MKKMILALLAVVFQTISGQNNGIILPELFSDNMMLQRETEASVWGKGNPGVKIEIEGSWGEKAFCIAGENGRWSTKIKTPKAGGPFEMVIKSDGFNKKIKNILSGEVWLCSGQSNMEMPLSGWPPRDTILNSSKEISEAAYPQIRFFTVTKKFSVIPEFSCSGSWTECSPKTAGDFSAAAFFFGKKLYKELGIPVGLIHSSWGGTQIEAWTSPDYLEKLEEYKDDIPKITGAAGYFSELEKWRSKFKAIDLSKRTGDTKWVSLDFDDKICSSSFCDDSKWSEMNIPSFMEEKLIDYDGAVWFRKTIEIPEKWLGKKLELSLGPIDDMDVTYVNGVKVGGFEKEGFWQAERRYEVAEYINSEKNISIAVRVIDNQSGGGIYGKPEDVFIKCLELNEKIPLAGKWKYLPVAEYSGTNLFVYGSDPAVFASRPVSVISLNQDTPSVLYNAMISPLVPFTFKGSIWYQGEDNVGNPEGYKKLFPHMINCWREKFQNPLFPFYYVQIAPYNYGDLGHSQLLREAQLKTLFLQNTGMIVIMDIGNNYNIHPANKKDVGERLALWALAKDYGKNVVFSGPLYKSYIVKDGKIILSFDYADDGLVLKNIEKGTGFEIAGEDKIFKKADIKTEGNNLIVSSSEVKNPVAVRYAWENMVFNVTLFNKAGLPAPSFRTDEW